MTDKYYLYNLMAGIAQAGSLGNNISKEEFLEQYEGSAKKAEMEKIFSIFDKFDMSKDGVIDFTAMRKDGLSKWQANMSHIFFKQDTNNVREFLLDLPDNIEGEKISKDNFQEALETLNKLVEKKYKTSNEAKKKQNLEELKASNSEIPEKVLANIEHYISDPNTPIKIIDSGYEAVSQEEVIKFNSEGKRTTLTEKFINGSPSDFGMVDSITTLYDTNGYDVIEYTEKYIGGYTFTKNKDNNCFLKYGRNQLSYMPYLAEITVNTGLPNETTFAVLRDEEGNITDISNADNNQILKMSGETKKQLITLLNNDAVLGLNFDLSVNCNEVSVEIIKDENIPDKAKSEIDRLGYAGMLEGEDYKTELLENGGYTIEYLNNKSKDFSADKKKTRYYTDGTEITIEKKGDKVYVSQNNETKEYTIEEFQKLMPDERNFVQKPDTSDEHLENYQLFKIEESELADKLYKIGERKYISDTEYSQNIEKNTYNVKIQDDKIFVNKNGEEFSIDVSGMTDGEQKFIAESNPEALFRIAEKGIKLILQNPPSGSDGEYLPEENVIYIAPEASEVSILQRRIAHETGHSYYTHLNDVNKELEESFKKESEQYEREIEAIKASVTPEASSLDTGVKQGKALRKFDKYAPDGYDERYCAENVYEFVAEAYCLLVTGDAKSEFTIAKVYPETFELVKKMIEESH